MADPDEPQRSGSWHESLATVLIVLIAAAVLTAACRGIALIDWAQK